MSKSPRCEKLLEGIASLHILDKRGISEEGTKNGKQKTDKPVSGTADKRLILNGKLPSIGKKIVADNQFTAFPHEVCGPSEEEIGPRHMKKGLDGTGAVEGAAEYRIIGKNTGDDGAAPGAYAPFQQPRSFCMLNGTDGNTGKARAAERRECNHAAPDPAADVQDLFGSRRVYTPCDYGVHVVYSFLPASDAFAPESPVNTGVLSTMAEGEETGGIGIVIAYNITAHYTWLIREPA